MLKVFSFNQSEFRLLLDNYGNPWFALSDLCSSLQIANARNVASRLDEDQKDVRSVDTLGGIQKMTFVNESGMYDVVLRSDKPEAKAFRKWITSEVLPTIRKHGGYLTVEKTEELINNPDLVIQLATAVKEEREKVKSLQAANARLQSKSDFVDKIIDTDEKIDIGQAAKILELPFGRNTLFQKLREKGVFFRQKNEPKQAYIERGYFQLKEKWIERNNHDSFMVIKVLVTQKGLEFISRMFSAEPDNKAIARLT